MAGTAAQIDQEKQDSGGAQRLAQALMPVFIHALILFVAAWRLDWWAAWAFVAASAAFASLNVLIILPKNPGLVARQGSAGNENVDRWDRALTRLVTACTLVLLVVAGLDERFGWTRVFAPWVQVAGLASFVLGLALVSWAMASNVSFLSAARVQNGQSVATGGPYRAVRHPGYVGATMAAVGRAALFGSAWALISAGLIACAFVICTALEDRTLRAELPGYADYAQRTRYRLLPGVW